jgi:hypothetical protein
MKRFLFALSTLVLASLVSCGRSNHTSTSNRDYVIPDLRAWNEVKEGLSVAELEKLLGQPIRRLGPDGDYKPGVVYRWTYGYVVKQSDVFPQDVAFVVHMQMGKVWLKEDPFGGVAASKDGTPTVPKLMTPPDAAVFNHYPRFVDFRWNASSGDYPMKYEIEISVLYPSGEWSANMKPPELSIPYYSYSHPGANRGRWRVRGLNSKGKSQWSEYSYFEFKI